MNIVFQINGGIGKCVIATAVCEAIKKEYPKSKLIVISGYPDVFLNNPNVDRAFVFGGVSYFYEEYIEDKEFKIFAHDPCLQTEHVEQKEHLIKTWCEMFSAIVLQADSINARSGLRSLSKGVGTAITTISASEISAPTVLAR